MSNPNSEDHFDEGADVATNEVSGGRDTADVKKLRAERDELYDRLARVTADFQNARKRLEADMEQRMAYANSGLIKSLLPVIDNFERALAVDPAKSDAASILKGLQLVHDQWLTVLRSQAVSEIAPQPGDPFDPALHQALMQQPDEKYKDQGPTVVQLLQKGYSLNDRVLRPAQVAVSKTN
ncbi:MAG TPA: nucleotide exchange factor GrpE [Tepidisphaeraceae bacterium]|jgi:molecular chaperone GrpE